MTDKLSAAKIYNELFDIAALTVNHGKIMELAEQFATEKVKEHCETRDQQRDIDIRSKALEEAAKVCDAPVNAPLVARIPGDVLAFRIRALKDKKI